MLALLGIFERHGMRDFHRTACLCTLCSDRFVGDLFDQSKTGTFIPDQSIGRYLRILEIHLGCAPAIDRGVIARDHPIGRLVDYKDRHTFWIAAIATSACGHNQMASPWCPDYNRLVAVEDIGIALFLGCGFEISQIITPTRFGIGKGIDIGIDTTTAKARAISIAIALATGIDIDISIGIDIGIGTAYNFCN